MLLLTSLARAAPALAETRTYLGGEVTISSVTGATVSTYLRMKSVLAVDGPLLDERSLADGGVRLTFGANASAMLTRYASQEVSYVATLPAGPASITVDITGEHMRVVYGDGARSVTWRSLPKKVVMTSAGYAAMPRSITLSTQGDITIERIGLGPATIADGGALVIVGGTARVGAPTWELGGTDWDLAPTLGGTDYDFRIPATAAVPRGPRGRGDATARRRDVHLRGARPLRARARPDLAHGALHPLRAPPLLRRRARLCAHRARLALAERAHPRGARRLEHVRARPQPIEQCRVQFVASLDVICDPVRGHLPEDMTCDDYCAGKVTELSPACSAP